MVSPIRVSSYLCSFSACSGRRIALKSIQGWTHFLKWPYCTQRGHLQTIRLRRESFQSDSELRPFPLYKGEETVTDSCEREKSLIKFKGESSFGVETQNDRMKNSLLGVFDEILEKLIMSCCCCVISPLRSSAFVVCWIHEEIGNY